METVLKEVAGCTPSKLYVAFGIALMIMGMATAMLQGGIPAMTDSFMKNLTGLMLCLFCGYVLTYVCQKFDEKAGWISMILLILGGFGGGMVYSKK